MLKLSFHRNEVASENLSGAAILIFRRYLLYRRSTKSAYAGVSFQ